MSLENNNDAETGRKSSKSARGKGKGKQTPEVGTALRAIYQHTIDEDIPSEMLSLLGKLD